MIGKHKQDHSYSKNDYNDSIYCPGLVVDLARTITYGKFKNAVQYEIFLGLKFISALRKRA